MSEFFPEFYQHDTPIAQREHKCCECYGIISKGECYHRHIGKWGGDFDTFKVCADCENLRFDIDKNTLDLEEKTAFGYLAESCQEHYDKTFLKRYVAIRIRRNGRPIPDWMAERANKL